MNEEVPPDWLSELPAPPEIAGFPPEAMFLCGRCERSNPPTRRRCFYCGAELEITEAQKVFLRPNLRKLEAWEKGFNVIIKPSALPFDKTRTAEIAKILRLDGDAARKIIEAGKFLPVARLESANEAEIAQRCLENFAVETIVVSDEELNVEKPPRRLRGIEFFGDRVILIFFNQDEIVEIAAEHLSLIVTGAVFERKIAATESRRKKGENEIVDSTETASDDALIDIYSRADAVGYRIFAGGFDFSGLETEKEMLAKDNVIKVANKLRQFAANAAFIDDYRQVRECLGCVWEAEQKSQSHGLKRGGIGKFNLENVTTVNNLTQFTKYSRLHRNLL